MSVTILVLSGNHPLHVVTGDSTSPAYVTANITLGKQLNVNIAPN